MPGLRATLSEFAKGALHSGVKSGPAVTEPKQAVAIGLNSAPKAKSASGGGFLHHHAKAAAAFKAGDKASAMHHAGHMLAALKNGASAQADGDGDETPMPAPAAPSGLRGRLAAFKQS